ncbi:hypothetical protein TRFO_23469 [Tritrichomonas foetus]|uniref:Uncharacterized protein n=1 Tax=Tritrichomonas foetus TaxID=1144522 RepID=A0A1J4KEU0_9EUKA|nr:hypothetical protein TRFO_23469 [Tritrichomonas foetus]|eukprot:OHT08110.1 hypothetical protein TRFO_23469 [Tritrichomonas foetus]
MELKCSSSSQKIMTPLPEGCSEFITVSSPNSKNVTVKLDLTMKYIEFLVKEFQKYSELCNKKAAVKFKGTPKRYIMRKSRSFSVFGYEATTYLDKTPESNFLKSLQRKYKIKKEIEFHNLCGEVSSMISVLICFFQIHLDQKIPVFLEKEKFSKYCHRYFKKPSPFLTLKKIDILLTNKIEKVDKLTKYPFIELSQLKLALSESIKKFEKISKYSPYSEFDDFLFCFLQNSDATIEIQQTALAITGLNERNTTIAGSKLGLDRYTPNYNKFHNLKRMVLNLFDSVENSEEKDIVITTALIRIIFDAAYLFNFDFISCSATKFDINSQIIQKLQPGDLNITDGFLFSSSSSNFSQYETQTIHELMSSDNDFLEMSQKLENLCFYSNPVDISYIVYSVLGDIENRVSKLSKSGQKGTKFLEFDDLFLFFLCVFTFNPPKNAGWIAALLKRFSGLDISPFLQHASTFFIAVVDYVDNFLTENFPYELKEKITKLYHNLG